MSVPVQHPMYIDGQFVTWRGDAWIDVVNPATEAVISRSFCWLLQRIAQWSFGVSSHVAIGHSST